MFTCLFIYLFHIPSTSISYLTKPSPNFDDSPPDSLPCPRCIVASISISPPYFCRKITGLRRSYRGIRRKQLENQRGDQQKTYIKHRGASFLPPMTTPISRRRTIKDIPTIYYKKK